MKRRHHTPEQIIAKLREADALLANGTSISPPYLLRYLSEALRRGSPYLTSAGLRCVIGCAPYASCWNSCAWRWAGSGLRRVA
ncbi:MAG TPA: hypothetical protein VGM03_20375 [Phycisphaerae bacterium]